MQIFNYKPKSDIKTMLTNYWPIPFAVGLALFFILNPINLRLFRVIRISHPFPAIIATLFAIAIVVYYVMVEIPRIQNDLKLSQPIKVENGVITYTKTKGGNSEEMTFNVSDIKDITVDDDDTDLFFNIDGEIITIYASYFDDDAQYQEFKSLLGS